MNAIFAESAFLRAVAAYLESRAGSARVGFAEPVETSDLDAIVLSLDSVQRLGNGLGEHSLVTKGALRWTSTIDLADPALPGDPSFKLFSTARPRELILPHGGLRRADGEEGSLGPNDLVVDVRDAAGAQPRTVVTGAPGAGEVRADAIAGILTFGDDLTPGHTITVTYFLGQWERRTTQIAGTLRATVRATAVSDLLEVSDAVYAALAEAHDPAIAGLRRIALTSLSSIAAPDAQHAGARGRTALFTFDYEHELNRPDSSGGIIQRVNIDTLLKLRSLTEEGVSA